MARPPQPHKFWTIIDGRAVPLLEPPAILTDVEIKDCHIGLVVDGGHMAGSNVEISDCDTGVDARDAVIDIDDLQIS